MFSSFRFRDACSALTLAVALLLAIPQAHAAKKVALVIGNAAYAEAPLKNPANDARAIAATLRRQGFEVLLKENATKAQMNEAVADFGEKLAEGDTALFFFAGHGLQVQGRNHLIPTDAKITSEQRVRLETLDVEAVLDQMAAARARVSMVILDACRNNPFERRFRSAGGGLAQISAPEGTMIAYATSPGKVAADGEGSNGLYTQELLKALAQPGLKVEDVFKQVRIGVSRASNGAQVPWEASSLTGDFFFQPASLQAATPAASVDRETTFWNSVRDTNNPDELRAYLSAYPAGAFATEASTRAAALDAARQIQLAGRPTQMPAATAANRSGRADDSFNGVYSATVPAGAVGDAGFLMFATIQRGVLRFNGNMPGHGTAQTYVCAGTGAVGATGSFQNTEIDCRADSAVAKATVQGVAVAGKEIRATIALPDGRKTEIVFR